MAGMVGQPDVAALEGSEATIKAAAINVLRSIMLIPLR